jgi:hypothetical protein
MMFPHPLVEEEGCTEWTLKFQRSRANALAVDYFSLEQRIATAAVTWYRGIRETLILLILMLLDN